MSDASKKLLHSIGAVCLAEYFGWLDELRDSGNCNMYLAGSHLRAEYAGMSKLESQVIAQSWRDTFSASLPAEDRVEKALS